MADRPNVPLVVIADDEPDILDLVRMVLEEEGYEVETADNGASALRLINERRPDLCVLDVMMPEVDGYDVARVLKRDEELRDIPVILLTARTEPENVARGRESGADEYIAKPFMPEEFQSAVRSVLSSRADTNGATPEIDLELEAPLQHEEPQSEPQTDEQIEQPQSEEPQFEAPQFEAPQFEPQPQPQPEPVPPPGQGFTVLLAGPNPNLMNVARYRLELGGYQVITAPDPMQALELAAQYLPDVFVLDATLPDSNPEAVAQLLRARQETERIAFVALSNGGPFDAQQLFTQIESALAQR